MEITLAHIADYDDDADMSFDAGQEDCDLDEMLDQYQKQQQRQQQQYQLQYLSSPQSSVVKVGLISRNPISSSSDRQEAPSLAEELERVDHQGQHHEEREEETAARSNHGGTPADLTSAPTYTRTSFANPRRGAELITYRKVRSNCPPVHHFGPPILPFCRTFDADNCGVQKINPILLGA